LVQISAMRQNPELGAVILAAGASRRMGRAKLLLPWGKTTVIGHLINQWHDLGAGQIAVVLRPDDSTLAAELDQLGFSPSNRIPNPDPERGMYSSILCAAHWLGWRSEISRWAIVLGDQPHLRAGTLRSLLAFSAQHPTAICQPVVGDRTAHPVILPRTALASLTHSPAGTLKEFLQLAACPSVKCPISDSSLTLDLDTPEDYKRLQLLRAKTA
jgi:molybdenum cofactor cytidylyltransferase